MSLKLLLIGGTGNISSCVARLAAETGHRVTILTRGTRPALLPSKVARVAGDAAHVPTLAALAARGFDAVVDFVAFGPEDARRDVAAFQGRVGQYMLISSATVYRRPPPHYLVTEDAPLGNPYWEYARNKIAAEQVVFEAHHKAGFPATAVRPSYTYGESWVPTSSGSDYTVVHRLRQGLEVVVPGDGSSLIVLTHAEDFARGLLGLLGNPAAIGEAFHVTSDEVLTWNQVHETIARVAGVAPRIVHVPSEFIARIDPRRGASLLGDKAWSIVFDNAKLRRLVPGFRARIPFEAGVRRSIAWLEADPTRQRLDADASVERVLAAWHRAMDALAP